MNKGQVFTADLVASVTIFSFFLIFFGILWNVTTQEASDNFQSEKVRGAQAFELLKTEGNPPDWNKTTVRYPGIYNDSRFDRDKFLALKNLPNQRKTDILRSRGFQIKVEYLNGTILEEEGKQLQINSSKIPKQETVNTYRSLALDHKTSLIVKISFYRWNQ